jgi:hypothetical protein
MAMSKLFTRESIKQKRFTSSILMACEIDRLNSDLKNREINFCYCYSYMGSVIYILSKVVE